MALRKTKPFSVRLTPETLAKLAFISKTLNKSKTGAFEYLTEKEYDKVS